MVYTVIYNIKDIEREEKFLSALKEEGDNVLFMQRCYFLISNESRELIYDRLREVMEDSDLLYMSETPVENMSGWLPTSVVDWLKDKYK